MKEMGSIRFPQNSIWVWRKSFLKGAACDDRSLMMSRV
ncbi:hypothetical protein KC19_7G049800 [Ceratodon purpureus]|uniref:Uncharacterized protein n=1 Tax=Ceratodon purpureus TaxID=3225 RepID=A0A8T0H798_CERPU|nr:hypothetical protein KC19_7G049800 [Ceratodon purpureus]